MIFAWPSAKPGVKQRINCHKFCILLQVAFPSSAVLVCVDAGIECGSVPMHALAEPESGRWGSKVGLLLLKPEYMDIEIPCYAHTNFPIAIN
jgi:hypothetical protein